jgi:hypothetical protein
MTITPETACQRTLEAIKSEEKLTEESFFTSFHSVMT